MFHKIHAQLHIPYLSLSFPTGTISFLPVSSLSWWNFRWWPTISFKEARLSFSWDYFVASKKLLENNLSVYQNSWNLGDWIWPMLNFKNRLFPRSDAENRITAIFYCTFIDTFARFIFSKSCNSFLWELDFVSWKLRFPEKRFLRIVMEIFCENKHLRLAKVSSL